MLYQLEYFFHLGFSRFNKAMNNKGHGLGKFQMILG